MATISEPLECLDDHTGETCDGPVEYRYPGYGEKYWPRCEFHGEKRIEREEENQQKYGGICPPSDWSPMDAGEHWGEDDY